MLSLELAWDDRLLLQHIEAECTSLEGDPIALILAIGWLVLEAASDR